MQNLSKKLLGQIGEDVPESEFTDIINLNAIKHNFPVFDILAKRGDDDCALSVKARKRVGQDGRINPCYNILTGSKTMARKYRKALDLFTELGYDTTKIHYCFLVVPLEENAPCVYYWGKFTDINPACTTENILNNKIRYLGVPVSDEHLRTYNVFGTREWSFVKSKYLTQ